METASNSQTTKSKMDMKEASMLQVEEKHLSLKSGLRKEMAIFQLMVKITKITLKELTIKCNY